MDIRKPIKLAEDTITAGDFEHLAEWLKTYPKLTKGQQTEKFESQWAEYAGTKYAVFLNSGSSANLLMIYALIVEGRLKAGDKVIVPSLCWVTTIAPVIQFGLIPILCDCNMLDLSIDLEHLSMLLIKEKPKALVLVTVLGLVPEMGLISAVCKNQDVMLLIDNCESQGSKIIIATKATQDLTGISSSSLTAVSLERFGLMSSCSTYFGHILSTIEGGMITTDDEQLYNTLVMLRSHGWDRDLSAERQAELRTKHGVNDFNALYTFYHPGFNLRSTDLQAFIGILQLKKLDQVIKARNDNYKLYYSLIKNAYWTQMDKPNVFVASLGYPVIHPERNAIVAELRSNQVEVRPLISGSMGKQPFFTDRYGAQESLPNVDIVDRFGFYVPNHPYLESEEIEFICGIINKYEYKNPGTDV